MNMLATIVPKSDQINADDLIGKTMTITIRDVKFSGGQEQPVSMYFDGSDKAFRPCKSMCRVLVAAWGPDAKEYVGRSLTLYRDPSVKWGGLEVGGIRISHMTHIDSAMTMALTATKGARKPFTVKPLTRQNGGQDGAAPKQDRVEEGVTALLGRIFAAVDGTALAEITGDPAVIKQRGWLAANRPELAQKVDQAVTNFADNPFAEGRADEDHGDQHVDDNIHPAQATADALIQRCKDAAIIGDVVNVETDFLKHSDAMPDEMVADVESAIATAKSRLKGAK